MNTHFTIAAGALLFLFSMALSAMTTSEVSCSAGAWGETSSLFYQRSGCLKVGKSEVRYKGFAFDLSTHVLGLRGSKATNQLPTLDDVKVAENTGKAEAFSVSSAFLPEDLLLVNAGYPVDPRFFTASGLVRINGADLSERDTIAEFKSAMFCLNEAKYSKGAGSRVIIFNAFENYSPIILNDRVMDADNCMDVIQVGPRIVEYRAKEGIKAGERREKRQRYTVFAQGNGGATKAGAFKGYIYRFEDPINLFDIQKFLLSPESGNVDNKMRVAVVIASDEYSGLVWRGEDGRPATSGVVNKAHPVFLSVRQIVSG